MTHGLLQNVNTTYITETQRWQNWQRKLFLILKHQVNITSNCITENTIFYFISFVMFEIFVYFYYFTFTPGLGNSCDILQMALVDLHGKYKPWSQYMQPTQPIHPGASRVNKLSVVNDNLCYNGRKCDNVVPAEEGIIKFLGIIR